MTKEQVAKAKVFEQLSRDSPPSENPNKANLTLNK
jgi:hypothetical protein